MPRRRRVFVEGGIYHVYNRCARGEHVLGDADEAIRFVELLRFVKERDDFNIFAWCVMSNHYHLAIRTSVVPLPRTMHYLQGRFSRDFNRRWGRTGPLWQSRYKAKLIDDRQYLPRLIEYIHLNPVKGGIVDNPSGYSFSGHRELVGKVRDPVSDPDEALLCFGPSLKSARRSYTRGLNIAMKSEDSDTEVGRLPWWVRERDLEPQKGRAFVDELGRSTGLERLLLDAKAFIELASDVLNVRVDRLASKRQDRTTARQRRLIASCGVERWEQRSGQLARELQKHSVVVSRWVAEARELRKHDEGFSAELESLDKELSKRAVQQLASGGRKRGGSGPKKQS
jgi:REP element-mobilizing transposase RayT